MRVMRSTAVTLHKVCFYSYYFTSVHLRLNVSAIDVLLLVMHSNCVFLKLILHQPACLAGASCFGDYLGMAKTFYLTKPLNL